MLLEKRILKGDLCQRKAKYSNYIPKGQIGWVTKLHPLVWSIPRNEKQMLREIKDWAVNTRFA